MLLRVVKKTRIDLLLLFIAVLQAPAFGEKVGTVTVAPDVAKISDFRFSVPFVAGTITGDQITVEVPFGTDLSRLRPIVQHSGTSISPDPDTDLDFRIPQTFVVSSKAGKVTRYRVDVRASKTRPLMNGFEKKAMNFTAWSSGDWSDTKLVSDAMDFLVEERCNVVVFDWIVPFCDDGTLSPTIVDTVPGWGAIQTAVTIARGHGLEVYLKPHVVDESGHGQNRYEGNTDPRVFLPEHFFPAWSRYLKNVFEHIAPSEIAALVIGTEMNFLDNKNREDWLGLIAQVRRVYPGPLTYDAMYSQYVSVPDLSDVVFWDSLDFISCSLYVRLTEKHRPSHDELVSLMRFNPAVEIVDAIEYLHSAALRFGKKVLAIEGGYQSAQGALWDVNGYYGSTGTEDQKAQADGIDAYLECLQLYQGDWFLGVSLWDLQARHLARSGRADPNYIKGWGIVEKSAASTVKKWYSKERVTR